MGLPVKNPPAPHINYPGDLRTYEHLAKVNRDGVVVAMVEVDAASDWEHWTDSEGNRYVYLTDLVGQMDAHGVTLLPPVPEPPPARPVSRWMRPKKQKRKA